MKVISFAFIGLTIVCVALLAKLLFDATDKSNLESLKKNRFKVSVFASFILWAIFVSVWSLSGKMGDFKMFPLNMMPVLAVPMIAILYFTFSKSTQPIIANLSQANIIALQSFRVVVEILLWRLFVLNEMPVQMSFEGQNWDVLTGITAIAVAFFASKNKVGKNILVIWNLLGLALLVNIVTIAILSMPTSFRVFMNEPANTIVTQFPISLLPGFLVPLAYGLHFISLRNLAIRKIDMPNSLMP